MSPLLALNTDTPAILAIAGIAFLLIGELWFLVAAAQRSVIWFLAVLFIPVANLVLVFIEPRARPPFLLVIVGIGLFVGTVVTMDKEKAKGMSYRQRVDYIFSDHDTKAAPAEPTLAEPTLAERQERIRTWQQELERKKAALKPYDAVAQAAFDKELNEYLAELKKVKDDMAKTGP